MTLNYIEYFHILASTVIGCISISASCFISWYSCRDYEFCNRMKICAVTAGFKKYNSTNQKKNKHDKIVLLAKFNLKHRSLNFLI